MADEWKRGKTSRFVQRKRNGLFITFEGIEGCGKTTQLRKLARSLRNQGYRVVETREPGGTKIAERIRRLLLTPCRIHSTPESLTPHSELTLILAGRSQHVANKIEPALRKGAIVLCDRFSDSTLAYQGYGRGINLHFLHTLNRFATEGLQPDFTILFDLSVSQGLARRRKTGRQNRLDREERAFHERVRKGFLALAKRFPRRLIVINGRNSPETVAAEVFTKARKALNSKHRAQLKTNKSKGKSKNG